jgi:hypothetical protein
MPLLRSFDAALPVASPVTLRGSLSAPSRRLAGTNIGEKAVWLVRWMEPSFFNLWSWVKLHLSSRGYCAKKSLNSVSFAAILREVLIVRVKTFVAVIVRC